MSYNDLFLRSCRKEEVERIPVWYMRQAGRYDPDYQVIKRDYSLLEICLQPELAAEVTLMPVKKLDVDAAILYSDIMNPVASIGIDFDIVPNVGPVVDNPIRTSSDIENLKPIDVDGDLGHVIETIKILDRELTIPLITFAGAPFTLASYLIEGRPSRTYIRTKELMYNEPKLWFLLMDKLGDMVVTYIRAQIQAGAKAIQLFDSWVGALSARDFKTYVYPVISRIFEQLSNEDVPKIYFPGVSSGELLPHLQALQTDVIGVDWRISIQEARKRLDHRFAIQGNLDPYTLMGPMSKIEEEAAHIIDQGILEPGYIFNFGHGLYPEASLEKLQQLTAFVKQYSAKKIGQRKK